MSKKERLLYREDLDGLQCATPGCDHTSHDGTMFFHGRCHPHGPAEVSYNALTGELLVVCAICNTPIAHVAVARRGYN